MIRSLLERKRSRDSEASFILEGAHPVIGLLRNQSPAISLVLLSPAFVSKQPADVMELFRAAPVPVYELGDARFARLSSLESSQGIMAVVRKPVWSEETILGRARLLGLFGEHLQDPTNVGALIRLAGALGLDAMWLTKDSADIYGPKVVRATAGTILSFPIFSCEEPQLFVERRCAVYAAVASSNGSVPIRTIQSIPSRTIVAVGNESRGLTGTTRDLAATSFHIPVEKSVESLNVATAAAISLFYLSGLPRYDS